MLYAVAFVPSFVGRGLRSFADSMLAAYGLAVLGSALALGVSLALAPVGGDDSIPGLLFLGAVGLSGWYGGFGPAVLTTVCGAAALDYFFETPPFELSVANPRTVTYLVSFLLLSVLLGSFNARLRESNRVLRVERDRAEAAVVARDDMIAIVSHDLRTPLTAIKTSMYTLRDPTIALTPETRNRLLANVEAEADRLVHAVTSALALRSLENGLSPHWERMEPSEVVSAALDRCLPALGSRQITFQVPDDLQELWMDAALLDQALTALFENVAVHTPAGSPLEIDGCLQNNDLVVSVSDAGPGVPADVRERIFERYERLDTSQGGVGLGLAIARAAIEAQGGRLCVADSKLGGACFTILIPQALEGRR